MVKSHIPKCWLEVGLRVKSEHSGSKVSRVAAARLPHHSSEAPLFVALNKSIAAIRVTCGIQSLDVIPRAVAIIILGDLVKSKIQRSFQINGIIFRGGSGCLSKSPG